MVREPVPRNDAEGFQNVPATSELLRRIARAIRAHEPVAASEYQEILRESTFATRKMVRSPAAETKSRYPKSLRR